MINDHGSMIMIGWMFHTQYVAHDHDECFILNMLLGNARPGDASAATESTKGGDEGRQHLGSLLRRRDLSTLSMFTLLLSIRTIDTTCYLIQFVHLRPFARLGHIFHVSTSAAKETKHLSCLKRPPRVITEYTDKSQRQRRHKIVTD